jgi:hypothetical protein
VCLGDVALVGLGYEEAGELVWVLNRQELEIQRAAPACLGGNATPRQSLSRNEPR